MANNENLKKGKDTQFVAGELQAKVAAEGGRAKAKKVKEKKLYAEQLEVVIRIGKEKALELAKQSGNEQAIAMIEEGGLIAFEHLNIAMDKKVKAETRLKALDMMIDRQEGKAKQALEIPSGVLGTKVIYISPKEDKEYDDHINEVINSGKKN